MSLARLLSDQRGRLNTLTQLLEHELEQLTASQVDGDALAQLARRKQELLAEMERMELSLIHI